MVIMSINDYHILFLMPYFVKFHIISPLNETKKQNICTFLFRILLAPKVYVQVIPNLKTTQKGLL